MDDNILTDDEVMAKSQALAYNILSDLFRRNARILLNISRSDMDIFNWNTVSKDMPLDRRVLLYRGDMNKVKFDYVDSKWIGNPEYAYTMYAVI